MAWKNVEKTAVSGAKLAMLGAKLPLERRLGSPAGITLTLIRHFGLAAGVKLALERRFACQMASSWPLNGVLRFWCPEIPRQNLYIYIYRYLFFFE